MSRDLRGLKTVSKQAQIQPMPEGYSRFPGVACLEFNSKARNICAVEWFGSSQSRFARVDCQSRTVGTRWSGPNVKWFCKGEKV